MSSHKKALPSRTLHPDELAIEMSIVQSLLDRDAPELASGPLRPLESSGSTNALFRLGDDLLVRMPRMRGGGASIDKEARWIPMFSKAIPVAIPDIVAVGEPGFGYPERWSVTRWLDGEHPLALRAPESPSAPLTSFAEDLADVVLALRALDVPHAVGDDLRWYRGGALSAFDSEVRRQLVLCRGIEGLDLDLDKATSVWDEALSLPGAQQAGSDHWFHGDLVAENLLVADGRLAAVLDFGAVSVGDPTIDLHGAWEIFDVAGRDAFAKRLAVDEAEWLRGRAWALGIALGALTYYWHTMPGRRRDRLAMASNVLSDEH